MRMQSVNRFVLLIVAIASGISCGDVARQGRSPVFLVIDRLEAARGGATVGEFGVTLFSDVITIVTTPRAVHDDQPVPDRASTISGSVTLRIVPKDLGTPTAPTVPTSNNDVTITRYRVSYQTRRRPEHPASTCRIAFDGAVTGTVPVGRARLTTRIPARSARREAGDARSFSSRPARHSSTQSPSVTFYGQDLVGNDISVDWQSIQIEFGNFGD